MYELTLKGKGGTGVLSVDGKEVAREKIPHITPFVETIDETFDVGVDSRKSVEDKNYQPPFRQDRKTHGQTGPPERFGLYCPYPAF